MRLSKLPPMVNPKRTPDEIVDRHMDSSERVSMVNHLAAHQKAHGEWETYRKKIPSDLLQKWQRIMAECRQNGFMAPRVHDDKIVWSQVMGFKRNYRNADECCLCSNSQTKNDCAGQMLNDKNGQRQFVPCWIGGN